MNNQKRQLTAQDLFSIALAEYAVQHPQEGYPDSWWDMLDGDTEERFDKLPQAAQKDIEKRMSAFIPSISELFEELDDYDDDQDMDEELDDDDSYYEDPDEQEEREEERQNIIRAIHDSVIDEFDDFLAEDD